MSVSDEACSIISWCAINLISESVPDEACSRNLWCAINLISASVPDEACSRNLWCAIHLISASVPDEACSRNLWCGINLISAFLLKFWRKVRLYSCSLDLVGFKHWNNFPFDGLLYEVQINHDITVLTCDIIHYDIILSFGAISMD